MKPTDVEATICGKHLPVRGTVFMAFGDAPVPYSVRDRHLV